MAIFTMGGTPEAIRTVLENVGTHLGHAPEGSTMRAMGMATERVSVSQPHRVFSATLEDVMADRLLANARETTTRFFLVRDADEPFATAEVRGAEFDHLNEGPFVLGTARAMVAAEQLDASTQRDYEMRLLRIPALYTVAVWLASPADNILIPAAPAPEPLIADRPYDERAFTDALRPLAETRGRADERMG